MVLIKIMVLMD